MVVATPLTSSSVSVNQARLRFCKAMGTAPVNSLKILSQPFSRGRLTVKTVDVGRKNYEDRHDRAQRLHALDHVAAADLLNEFFEESKRELLGDHVRHEKCAAFRLADSRPIARRVSLLPPAARNNLKALSRATRSQA